MNQYKKLSKQEKAKYIARIALYPLMLLFSQLGKVCKLFGTGRRKITASILCAAMVFTILHAMPMTAFAAATPLTFTAQMNDSSVTLEYESGDNVEYNKNDEGWTTCPSGTSIPLDNAGDTVRFRGTNVVTDYLNHFSMTGTIAASGDVTSLTNQTGGNATLTDECYTNMFVDCTSLTQAPALPSTTLADYCYSSMFTGCTGLTAAPALPATTLTNNCYSSMFNGCTSLSAAPELPATTLADFCYCGMFNDCTSLNISATQTGAYTKAWRIPTTGDISTTANEWNIDMLYGTGGTFTRDPDLNKTYYVL